MSTVSIDLRKAQMDDGPAVAWVHDAAWRTAYRGIIPCVSLERMVQRRGPKWWTRALRKGTQMIVLDIDQTVAGYVTYGRNRARSLPLEGEIYELYVHPDYQGLGFGNDLFHAARNSLKRHGARGLVCWTLKDNDAATRFYAQRGGDVLGHGVEKFDDEECLKIAFGWFD